MKKFLLAIIVLLGSCGTYNSKNDLEKENLQGNVKSVMEIHYNVIEKFGKIEKGEKKGFITIHYNQWGNKFEKNLLGAPISVHLTLRKRCSYQYDDQGNMNEESCYNLDGSLYRKHIYKYDNVGNMIERNDYNANGNLEIRFTFKNDDQGKNTESIWYTDPDSDQFTTKTVYEYDDRGNMIEGNDYSFSGNFKSGFTRSYDELGNKVEETIYDRGDKNYNRNFTYKYDEQRNVVEKNVINSSPRYSPDLFKYSHEYEYDKSRNWVKNIRFLDGKPYLIIKREIEYFK